MWNAHHAITMRRHFFPWCMFSYRLSIRTMWGPPDTRQCSSTSRLALGVSYRICSAQRQKRMMHVGTQCFTQCCHSSIAARRMSYCRRHADPGLNTHAQYNALSKSPFFQHSRRKRLRCEASTFQKPLSKNNSFSPDRT